MARLSQVRVANIGAGISIASVEEGVIHFQRALDFAAVDEQVRQTGAAHAPHVFVSLLKGERPCGLEVRECALRVDVAQGQPECGFPRH